MKNESKLNKKAKFFIIIGVVAVIAVMVAVILTGCNGKDDDYDDDGNDKKGGVIDILDKSEASEKKNPVPENHDEDACGENLTWSYDDAYETITISGNGEMWDYIYKENGSNYYSEADTPWDNCEFDTIVIEDGVEKIGDYAFTKCYKLYYLTLPDTIKSIGDYAFDNCYFIQKLNLPEGVTEIGKNAFSHCTSLTEIKIPASVKRIGENAFFGCDSRFINDIELSENVEYIGLSAFDGMKIQNIEIAEGNKYYSDIDGILFNKDKTEIIFYPGKRNAKTYEIPSGVKKINDYAFHNASWLEKIEIPDGVTEIGDYAFNVALKDIELPDSIKTIGEGAFSGTQNSEFIIPEGVENVGNYAFSWCKQLKKITIPASVKSIGGNVFFSTELEEIHFGGTKSQWEALGIDSDTIQGVNIIFGK